MYFLEFFDCYFYMHLQNCCFTRVLPPPKEVASRELVRSISHSNINTVVVTMARNHNKRNGGAKGATETLNYSPTAALFHWVEPVSSGVVLALGLLILLSLSCYSTISILANLLLLGVVVGLGSKMYVHLMGMLKKPCKDPLAQLAVVDLSIPEDCEHLAEFVKSCVDTYNTSASTLRSVLLGEDMYGSLKFGLVVYMLTFVGAILTRSPCSPSAGSSPSSFPRSMRITRTPSMSYTTRLLISTVLWMARLLLSSPLVSSLKSRSLRFLRRRRSKAAARESQFNLTLGCYGQCLAEKAIS